MKCKISEEDNELLVAASKMVWNINNVGEWLQHAIWCNYSSPKGEKCNCGVADIIAVAKKRKKNELNRTT